MVSVASAADPVATIVVLATSSPRSSMILGKLSIGASVGMPVGVGANPLPVGPPGTGITLVRFPCPYEPVWISLGLIREPCPGIPVPYWSDPGRFEGKGEPDDGLG
jgi:hypothetical protein